MSDVHPDPLSESFRHVNTHAQTLLTGAARAAEAAAARTERRTRMRIAEQQAAREQLRAQVAASDQVGRAGARTVTDTARQDAADMTAERADGTLDATAVTGAAARAAYPHGVTPDSPPGSGSSPGSENPVAYGRSLDPGVEVPSPGLGD